MWCVKNQQNIIDVRMFSLRYYYNLPTLIGDKLFSQYCKSIFDKSKYFL